MSPNSPFHFRGRWVSLVVMMIAALLMLAPARVECQEAAIDEDRPLLDRPAQAASFRALLTGGQVAAEVAPQALPAAEGRIEQLRQDVATRFASPAAEMMIAAAAGSPATVGGIPVGPLPGVALPLDGELEVVPLALPLAAGATINPAGWKWLGPGNIGGRMRSILIHPQEPNTIWIGGVGGGVWKTVDGGVSWAPLYDFMANLAISCMLLHPSDPDTLYVGTGEGFYNADSVRGFGIFVSKNGGATWDQLVSTANDDFRFVNRLAAATSGMNEWTLLVATRNGLYRSTDGGTSFSAVGAPMNQEILDVRFHPQDGQKCVAGARSGKSYYSTDGGTTWTASNGIGAVSDTFRGRVELTYAVGNGDVVYASVDDGPGKVYRSTDGGVTFALRSSPGHLSGQGWYANCLWAGDPSNPNLLVVGGLDLHRSTNGGTTFTKISTWQQSPISAHADHHAIVAHPNYDGTTVKTVFFGNDGGLYRADDVTSVQGQNGWTELNNGLGITQFYAAAAHPPTGRVVGGTQDNGTLFFTPGTGTETWGEIFGGDGGDSAADPVEEVYYGEYVRLQIHRGKNGNPSAYIFSGITDAGSSALFIAPFILDPNNSSRMLAGGASLWRSNDIKVTVPTWKKIRQPGGGFISAIAVAPGDSQTVWVGTQNGQVDYSTNATAVSPTWTTVGPGVPGRYCSRITFDPHDGDHSTVYVTSTGYHSDNLHKSVDGGATWATLGAGVLPAIPYFDVAVHPTSQNLLYLGTELGLFVSDDEGATWSPTNQGPANVPVYRLFWQEGRLYVVTHGRGIFYIDLTAPATHGTERQIPAAADIAQ